MKRTKDQELYQEIASLLIASAPEEATKIIIRIYILDDYSSPRLRWYSSEGKKLVFKSEYFSKISDLFRELRKYLSRGKNQEKFSYSEMTVLPKEDKFTINFKYTDIEGVDWNQFDRNYEKEMDLEKNLRPGRDQEIYQELSAILMSSVEEHKDATRIQYRVLIQEDYFSPKYRWYKSNGDRSYFFPKDGFQVTYLTKELREYEFRLNNQAKFTYFEMSIDPRDGKYTINFEDKEYDLGEWLALDKLPEEE